MTCPDFPDKQRRDTLEREGRELKKKAEALRDLGSEMSAAGARIDETADLLVSAAQVGNPYGDWEGSFSAVEEVHSIADDLLTHAGRAWSMWQPALNTSGSALVDRTFTLVALQYYPPINRSASAGGFEPEVVHVRLAYDNYFDRQHIRDEVVELMLDYGFSATDHGGKAIKKFTNAWEMYDQSPLVTDPALGTLISLRQSVILTIDELRRRKTIQQKSKDEIIDIGAQLATGHLPAGTFQGIADDWKKLEGNLSKSKDVVFSREEERELLQRGTYLLHRLLNAVDSTRLKKVR